MIFCSCDCSCGCGCCDPNGTGLERERKTRLLETTALVRQRDRAWMQLDALTKATETILEGFERNLFIRNISGDGESHWALKFIPYAAALGKATKVIEAIKSARVP